MSVEASLFPIFSEEDWRKAASTALKGAPLEKLQSKTSDGIVFGPLHAPAGGPRPLRSAGPWKILARVDHSEPSEANAAALEDLGGGAEGLQIVFAGAAGAYGYGLPDHDSATLDKAFHDVDFQTGVFDLDLGPRGYEQAKAFAALAVRLKADPTLTNIHFGLDPLGAALGSGRAEFAWADEELKLAAVVVDLQSGGFSGPFIVADGRPVHASGGTPAQELGFAIACGVAYWRALEASGLSSSQARAAISFRLAADADQYVTLSKFRALRLLWAAVETEAGLEPVAAHVSAETAWRMMTARDPFVNVMRNALAAFAAGLGGADRVSALPFSRALGLPDSFARRLARNTQLIELRESNLGFVDDPAAGAGVFEHLTHSLCEKGWREFQALDREGGVAGALRRGEFQSAVRSAAGALAKDISRLKAPLTGVTAHPHIGEAPIDMRPAPHPEVAVAGESFAPPLVPLRVAEPFENLRDAADALPVRPKMFLAAIGAPSAHSRRVSFARDLIETAGVAAETDPGSPTAEAASGKFRASEASFACICGSDEDYATKAADFASALKGAGATYLILAGRPGEHEAAWRAAGVDDFIFAGQDALAFLTSLLKRAGASL